MNNQISTPGSQKKKKLVIDGRNALRNKAASKADKKPQLRDLFRLRYFRFQCKNIEKTVDFYQSFGMMVLYDEVQEKIGPAPTGEKPVITKKKGKEFRDGLAAEDFFQLGKSCRVVAMVFEDGTGEVTPALNLRL